MSDFIRTSRGILSLICLTCLAAATQPTSAPSKRNVPGAEAQATMQKLVRELYAAQYADHTSSARQKLANRLLEQADRTKNDSTARYILWKEATELGCEAGDSNIAMRALTQMDQDFDINAIQLKESALRKILRSIQTPQQAQAMAHQALILADDATLREDGAAADQLVLMAEAAADKSGQVSLALQVRDRKREYARIRQEETEFQTSLVNLKQNRSDASDRLRIGKMQCFIRGNWAAGLPMLADGADTALKKAAQLELGAKTNDALSCMAVGNNWWDQAPAQARLARQQIRHHAAQWYRRAAPGLSGVNLEIVEKRLAEVPLTAAEVAALSPGLRADIFSGQNFDHFLVRRIDPQINFNWGTDAIGPTLPKDDFSLQWRGYVLVDRDGEYTFVLLANSGGRLTIDGITILSSDKLSHSRKGARAKLYLSSGAHSLRAACWDGGGTAKAILQWIVPGESEPVVVPPEVLRRE
jgi:hypothetical protein